MKALEFLDNASIAELLALDAENSAGHLKLALKRACREAMRWPEEAFELKAAGRSLTELGGVGPAIGRRIHHWIDSPPARVKPPELRAEFLTAAKARRVLAQNPSWRARLNGDLQMHTVWSDGSGTVADMAAEAVKRGYEYIAITNHTKGLKIANGLDEKRLRAQAREIESVNRQLKKAGTAFTVLRSTEVNLSPLGAVDMDARALAKLDIVLGSFHSSLRKTDDQTARYLSALRNPSIHTLGHPKGRVYNYRLGLNADWPRVFAQAAKLDKAVEIDGYADRQDLKLSLLRIARKEGCRISLGTDAHHPWQLEFMELALAAACLAKIAPERILNFLSADRLKQWVSKLRQ
jgi:histidinol phosphatase-like PHP family hydrolase